MRAPLPIYLGVLLAFVLLELGFAAGAVAMLLALR